MKKRILAAVLAVLMVVLLVPAVLISSISAATIYKTDFNSGLTSEWTKKTVSGVEQTTAITQNAEAPYDTAGSNQILALSGSVATAQIGLVQSIWEIPIVL